MNIDENNNEENLETPQNNNNEDKIENTQEENNQNEVVSGFYDNSQQNQQQTQGFQQQQNTQQQAPQNTGGKSKLVAILLSILPSVLTGGFVHGIHRLYLGYVGIGIIQILTLGGCGIWTIVDLILLATDKLKPADGTEWEAKDF